MASKEQMLIENQTKAEGRENIEYVLFDSMLTTVSVTQTMTFFQQTIGTVGRARTNMKSGGQLPSPQSFFMTAMAARFINLDGTMLYGEATGAGSPTPFPVNTLVSKGYFDFILDPSTEYEGSLSQLVEQTHLMQDAPASHLGCGVIGNAFLYNTLKFRKPIVIAPNRSFSVKVTLTAPAAAGGYTAANTALYIFLYGVLRRNP